MARRIRHATRTSTGLIYEAPTTSHWQKILDQGHGSMRLRDFVARANGELQRSGSKKRVTDAQVYVRATRTPRTAFLIKH